MTNPKTFGEMTDAEKGALLLADHEGKVIECYNTDEWYTPDNWRPSFSDVNAYRVKPEPEVVKIMMHNSDAQSGFYRGVADDAEIADGFHNYEFTFTDDIITDIRLVK